MVIPVIVFVAIPKIVMAIGELLLLCLIVGIRTAVVAAQLTLISLILVSVILVSHKHHTTVLTVLVGRLRLSTGRSALQLSIKELFHLV